MARKKKEEHEKEPNHERWLVSYADFITLLFAVFVTLYAMSQVDKAKVAKVIASTNEAFGVSKATSAPAFNIIESSSLVPLPNILKKSSTLPRPPTGENIYKTKEKKKPKAKDLVDEAFNTPDHAPAHKKELTEAEKKAELEAEKKALSEIQKMEQLKAAQQVLAELKKKEQVETQKIQELVAQIGKKPETAAQETVSQTPVPPKIIAKAEQQPPSAEKNAALKVPPVEATAEVEQAPETKAQGQTEGKSVAGSQGKVKADVREFKKIKKNIMAFLHEKGAEDKVNLQIDARGLVISLKDTAFFASGSATVLPASMPLLDNIAQAIDKYTNSIRIEGHTDNIPIKTAQFPSNWELSTARATNIVHYLVKTHGISPDRLSAVGYGEYRPIADNSTAEGRQKNRRVDIVVLSSAGEQGEPVRENQPSQQPDTISK
jgi:chemotaxis protein MotB